MEADQEDEMYHNDMDDFIEEEPANPLQFSDSPVSQSDSNQMNQMLEDSESQSAMNNDQDEDSIEGREEEEEEEVEAEEAEEENSQESTRDQSIQEPKQREGEDLSNKEDLMALKEKLEELIEEEPTIPVEETGFPTSFKGSVVVGKFIPINKKTWSSIEVKAEDAILDCPSQVVPLLIKKPDIFPLKVPKEEEKAKKAKKKVRFDGDEPLEEEDQDDFQEDSNEDAQMTEEEKAAEEERKRKEKEAEEQKKANTMLTINDYYKSSVGELLLGIGLSRATEWFHRDAIKQLNKAIHKEGELEEYVEEMTKQKALHQQSKQQNSIFVFPGKKCTICDFKSESSVGLEQHMSIPHLSNKREYRCNYCPFSTRDPRTILYHFQSVHNKPCLIEPPPQLYECPVCPYESSQKQKAAAHIAKCMKFFVPDRVQLMPDPETDYPAVTPRPIGQMDIKIYEATLSALRVLANNPNLRLPEIPGLPRGLQAQMLLMTQQQLAHQARNRAKQQPMNQRQGLQSASSAGRQIQGSLLSGGSHNAKQNPSQLYHMLQTTGQGHTQMVSVGSKATPASNALAQAAQLGRHQRLQGQSVLQGSNRAVTPRGPQPTGQMTGVKGDASKGGTFVICEICDGYIKDLEQLRTHMQWIHKVKIHPKMLASRPPLNCQKCQWRFFTDQGLERHLLGAHGLVTSNMQDMVNQSTDGGRCTVCGRVFANKLVHHMNQVRLLFLCHISLYSNEIFCFQVHKITLKPAHLSYKCTVCSATFNLYRLFESHVYMVHSGSVKRGATSGGGEADNNLVKRPRIISENSPANNGSSIW